MRQTLVVIFLVTLAGCTSPLTGSDTGTSTVEMNTTSPTDPATTVPAGADTVQYSELSETQQEAFDVAVESRAQFLSEQTLNSSYVSDSYFDRTIAEVFQLHEFVRKDGQLYRVRYEEDAGDTFASYQLRTKQADPTDNATVTHFESLSEGSQDIVEPAIQNGTYSIPAGKRDSLPEDIPWEGYIEYNNTTYRILVVSGDVFADTLTATPAS